MLFFANERQEGKLTVQVNRPRSAFLTALAVQRLLNGIGI
jgi:hypothetical protein